MHNPIPSRPITIVAPFPAGGPLDIIARVIAEPMREALGQPVVIENVAGAGGNLGVGRVARSEPDGYTVGIGQWSTHVVNPVTYTLPYDVAEDGAGGAARPSRRSSSSRARISRRSDVQGADRLAQGQPRQGDAGTVGAAGGAQVSAIYFQKETGTTLPLRAVPRRRRRRCRTWSAGSIDLMFDQAANALGPVAPAR